MGTYLLPKQDKEKKHHMDKEARGYLVARLVSKEINLGVPFPFHNSLLTAQFLLFDMEKRELHLLFSAPSKTDSSARCCNCQKGE